MTLQQLIREVHRRSLWQVLTVYVAASFAALQVVELVADNVGLPGWVTPFAIVLLTIGLPIVMATAVVQEGGPGAAPAPSTPDGETRRDPDQARAVETAVQRESREGLDHRKLFTWRNAITGGVCAFALLGFSATGWVTLRALGVGPAGSLVARGVLEDRAALVIADLGSATGDTLLARAATEALRVDLAESSIVRVLEPTRIAQALRRMQKPAGAPLDDDAATELAVREGASAVVVGDLNGVGPGFVLTATLVRPTDGETLASVRENASDSAAVIGAIDRLSKKLRERVGESYRSLRQAPPLERVTTSSLEALRKYSEGVRAIDRDGAIARGVAQLEEAVKLDTAFAMAYRKLAVTLGNQFRDRARVIDASTRAYRHRDRLTARERYLAEATYFGTVTFDIDGAVRAYQSMLDLDSLDTYALNNLGATYARAAQKERAAEYYHRAIRADSANGLSYTNLVFSLLDVGDIAQAEVVLAEAERRFQHSPRVLDAAGRIAVARWDHDTAERSFGALRDSFPGDVFAARTGRLLLSDIAATRGRLVEALAQQRELIAIEERGGRPNDALMAAIQAAALEAHVRQKPEEAAAMADEALQRYPLADMNPYERPYAALAMLYADAGRPDRAREILAEYDTAVPPPFRFWVEHAQTRHAEVATAIAAGSPEALDLARETARTTPCMICGLPMLGRAFEAAGHPDSAISVWERYVDGSSATRVTLFDRWYLASILERLGHLHEQRGDTQSAARYLGRFVELWEHADPELQPRVTAARQRLSRIVDRRS